MEGWGKITLAATNPDGSGNVTQLYPSWNRYKDDFGKNVTAGDALPILPMDPPGTPCGILLRPEGGRVGQVSVETDGTDGGTIQLYDVSGLDAGADVSSGTAITNAQLTSLINSGRAKLIWEQNFGATVGSPIIYDWSAGFMRGLAARFLAAAGTCALSLKAEGGYSWRPMPAGYAGG